MTSSSAFQFIPPATAQSARHAPFHSAGVLSVLPASLHGSAQVNELAAEWLSPLAVEVFRAELLARSASPAVEAQLQVCACECVSVCVGVCELGQSDHIDWQHVSLLSRVLTCLFLLRRVSFGDSRGSIPHFRMDCTRRVHPTHDHTHTHTHAHRCREANVVSAERCLSRLTASCTVPCRQSTACLQGPHLCLTTTTCSHLLRECLLVTSRLSFCE